jgi:hypothetical protein
LWRKDLGHNLGGWVPDSVYTLWSREKSLPLPGMDSKFPDCPARNLDNLLIKLSPVANPVKSNICLGICLKTSVILPE